MHDLFVEQREKVAGEAVDSFVFSVFRVVYRRRKAKRKKKWCYKMRDEKGNCWGTTLFIFRLSFTLFLGSSGF